LTAPKGKVKEIGVFSSSFMFKLQQRLRWGSRVTP